MCHFAIYLTAMMYWSHTKIPFYKIMPQNVCLANCHEFIPMYLAPQQTFIILISLKPLTVKVAPKDHITFPKRDPYLAMHFPTLFQA